VLASFVTLVATKTVSSDQLVRSDYINVTVPPPESTFLPVADSKVRSSRAGNNYGTEDNLRLRAGSAIYNSHLKFDVVGLGGSVQSAMLRLYVTHRRVSSRFDQRFDTPCGAVPGSVLE
jgi:hypothetical protein